MNFKFIKPCVISVECSLYICRHNIYNCDGFCWSSTAYYYGVKTLTKFCKKIKVSLAIYNMVEDNRMKFLPSSFTSVCIWKMKLLDFKWKINFSDLWNLNEMVLAFPLFGYLILPFFLFTFVMKSFFEWETVVILWRFLK